VVTIGLSDPAKSEVAPPGDTREQITAASLLGETTGIEMVHNANFMPIEPAGAARHAFSGMLSVPETFAQPVSGRFPGFSIAFFSHDGNLIPADQGIVPGGIGTWDLILSPGRVWSEDSDGGWSRASFPFVLLGRVWGDTHNGIATFLYNETEVSDLRVQIVQESSAKKTFDGTAQLPMSYAPGAVADRDVLEGRFTSAWESAPEIRAFSELASLADPALLAAFDGEAQDITVSALLIGDVLYATPCQTRFGDFPYCNEMRHGVYSVSKSLGAALSLLRLAQVYGDQVVDLRLADYLDVTADHDGWDNVTFGDALDMATGVGDNAPNRDPLWTGYMADEGSTLRNRIASAPDMQTMLATAFSGGNYPWGPGEVPRYNSAHTILLTVAMDSFLKTQEGPGADLWSMMTEDVLVPIGVLEMPVMRWNTDDGKPGVPIMAWGFVPTLSDIAQVANLLVNGGNHNGLQLLSPTLLEAFLQTPLEPGLPIDWENAFGRYRYHASFWMMPFQTDDDCSYWIPKMEGTGGNVVALLPNGMAGIRLADAYEGSPGQYEAEGMAPLANELEPFCP
jgi:hypothetical protein